jgi:hypothetical protein
MNRCCLTILRKWVMVWIGVLAGMGGLLIGCSSGGSTSGTAGVDIPQEGNQSPNVAISLPMGIYFKEGENIIFSGTATDAEDGQLNGNALVWASSIDGPIGNGPTLITSALTPGDHDITLSATDSDGDTQTTDPVSIQIEPTRFLKMDLQTTGVADASSAFDGDHDTVATISTAEAESIYFKAYIGGADSFHFRIKLGTSTLGSNLSVDGLDTDGNWQTVSDIDLLDDKTTTVKVAAAQGYMDSEGYINLRATLVNEKFPDSVPVYEIWRVDPVYAGLQTIGVDKAKLAFDGDRSTSAAITDPSISTNSSNFLHFKAYVGWGQPNNTFTFNVLMNSIGVGHYLRIYVEDIVSGNLKFLEDLSLNSTEARTVYIEDARSYLDAAGYISLRAYWVGFKTPGTVVEVYEIWRIDPIGVGHKTSFGWVVSPQSAVDGDHNSFAEIHYFWGELGHKDFLHLQTYVGDVSPISFSIATALSVPPDADVIVDGEYEPDSWSVIERIRVDGQATTTIKLPNAREFVNADGYLSLRVRWESDSMNHDAYIYEIRREED